jgi:hypothetical protein
MELARIEALLEKYFDAETSLAEEAILKQFFTSEEVPAHMEVYRPMFVYAVEESKLKDQTPYRIKSRKSLSPLMKIAASITVVVSIGIFAREYQQKKQAEYAYEQTMMAMELIANHFDKAKESISYLELYEESKNKIFK